MVVNQTTEEINIWTLTAEAKVKTKTQYGNKKQEQKNTDDIRIKEENNNEASRKKCLKNNESLNPSKLQGDKNEEDILSFSKIYQIDQK